LHASGVGSGEASLKKSDRDVVLGVGIGIPCGVLVLLIGAFLLKRKAHGTDETPMTANADITPLLARVRVDGARP